jgi:hypothetical protein
VGWNDTFDVGNVSACDQVLLSSAVAKWYHVDRVPHTLNLSNANGSAYFDSVLDWDKVDLTDPNGTEWLEVCGCKDVYTLLDWDPHNCAECNRHARIHW